ncbi:MAG: RNA 2',3'-cyclic phosphodiesterase [Jatrophihabitans sp.]
MRMFVAARPPDAAVEHLAGYLEPRQQAGGPLRWTSIEQWHLTLAFLPAVADADLDELVERLSGAIARQPGLSLGLAGAGAFPHPAAAKTLWAGVSGDTDALSRVADAARSASVRAGVEVDGGRFRPHLTLARIGRPVDVTRWLRVLELYTGPSWQAGELALFESHLGGGPGGRARHELRETFGLASPP